MDTPKARAGWLPVSQYTEYHDQVDQEPREPARPEPPPSSSSKRDAVRQAASGKFEAISAAGMVGTAGLSFVIALVIGAVIGWWLDKVTGWSPLFFFVFFLLGLVAGIRNVYLATKKYLK